MTASLRVFVSSVQKELEDERLIVQNLVNTDPFLARHPMRIVGLNRIRLNEYPEEALREGLVNAVAHRQYQGQPAQGEVPPLHPEPGAGAEPVLLSPHRGASWSAPDPDAAKYAEGAVMRLWDRVHLEGRNDRKQ